MRVVRLRVRGDEVVHFQIGTNHVYDVEAGDRQFFRGGWKIMFAGDQI